MRGLCCEATEFRSGGHLASAVAAGESGGAPLVFPFDTHHRSSFTSPPFSPLVKVFVLRLTIEAEKWKIEF